MNSTGPGYTENYKITYTWNNGNLLSVQVEDRYSDNEESGVLTTFTNTRMEKDNRTPVFILMECGT